jgi:6-pyruvoyltetrahydropterin/6-carboxytetrahydropterin synthase
MYRIAKKFEFAASHQLLHLPEGHKCHRMHGHNYQVELQFTSSTLDHRGFVIDYNDLQDFKTFLDQTMDHRHLNDVLPSNSLPTAENLADYLYHVAWYMFQFDEAVKDIKLTVRVSETPNTWAEYTQ